jgi:hypothetical protein
MIVTGEASVVNNPDHWPEDTSGPFGRYSFRTGVAADRGMQAQ